MYHATGRRKWLGIQKEVFDQGDKNKAFEACEIITAVNTWNISTDMLLILHTNGTYLTCIEVYALSSQRLGR